MSITLPLAAVPSLDIEITLDSRPLTHSVFAIEIPGLDLSRPLDDEVIAAIRDRLNNHGLVVFRGQTLTESQQIAFSRRFGELTGHVASQYLHPDHPEILVISNIQENGRNIGLADAGHHWHADLTYLAEPSLGALLYAREIPETGGDTLFADMTAAYEALAEPLKERLDGLKAVHRYIDTYERLRRENGHRPPLNDNQIKQVPDVVHPVVTTHPETGRKSLYVSEGFTREIVGLPKSEGDQILRWLFDHSTSQPFLYRHRWQVGDLLFWDNRSTIHKAVGGYALPQRRLMHRTTIKGPRPR